MNRVPKGTEDFNRKALEIGIEAGKNAMKDKAGIEDYADSSDQ